MPKLIKYLTISIFFFILAIISFLFYPFLNIKSAIYDKNILETPEIKNSAVIVKDYNPALPVVATIFKKETPEDQKKGTIVIQTKYNRVSLFNFLPLQKESRQIIIKNKTFEQIQDIVSKNDLTKNNPDPTNIEVECSSGCENGNSNEVSLEDQYYNGVINIRGKPRNVEDFKKLKVGMKLSEVKSLVGNSDMIISTGMITMEYERHFKLDSKDLNFVIVAFDKDADYYLDAKLTRVIVVTKDRTSYDL